MEEWSALVEARENKSASVMYTLEGLKERMEWQRRLSAMLLVRLTGLLTILYQVFCAGAMICSGGSICVDSFCGRGGNGLKVCDVGWCVNVVCVGVLIMSEW